MGDLLRFVDSVAASPTVRLNLNDETTWTTQSFDCPSPSLTRAASRNAMRDGISVASSSYDGRILTIRLLLQRSTQDLSATQVQALARELDREKNILQWQPTGATKPVFFTTYRSSMGNVKQWTTQAATREFEFELLADPFALGLRETLGPYTVNNDPAHATNGCYVDVTGVIGDVEAPCLIEDTGTLTGAGGVLYLAKRTVPSGETASDLIFRLQAESKTGGTATNPGGAANPAYSGTASTNYVSLNIPAGTSATPVIWDVLTGKTVGQKRSTRGRYRVMAIVATPSTVEWRARDSRDAFTDSTVAWRTFPNDGQPLWADLGLVDINPDGKVAGGLAAKGPSGPFSLEIDAKNPTGGTLGVNVDAVVLLPADEAQVVIRFFGTAGTSLVYDGIGDGDQFFARTSGSDLWAGTAEIRERLAAGGALGNLTPGLTNRWVVARSGAGTDGAVPPTYYWPFYPTNVSTLTFHYFPRYVNVRPAST